MHVNFLLIFLKFDLKGTMIVSILRTFYSFFLFRNVDNSWNKKRIPRSFYINNGKTELRIIQGDITKTKVDAIVNGL